MTSSFVACTSLWTCYVGYYLSGRRGTGLDSGPHGVEYGILFVLMLVSISPFIPRMLLAAMRGERLWASAVNIVTLSLQNMARRNSHVQQEEKGKMRY